MRELAASTLQPNGTIYPAPTHVVALATSPARGGIVATGSGFATGPGPRAVSVFPLGAPGPIFTSSAGAALPDGLALAGDGTAVFAVDGDPRGTTTLRIWVLPPA